MFEQCFSRCLLKIKILYNQYFTPYSKISSEENISENWVRLKERKPLEKQSLEKQSIEIKVT